MTLFTSATKIYRKTALVYLIISGFCAIFGAVYEHFSFGVYSPFMVFSFAFPAVCGLLPNLIFILLPPKYCTCRIFIWLYRCGIATLTIGSIIRGVLDIYGTTNALTQVYWWIGFGLLLIGVTGSGAHLLIMVMKKCNGTVSDP